MDWKKLQSDAKVWTDKTKDFAQKAYVTSQEYTEKAKLQGYTTLVHGKTGLSTVAGFEEIKDLKRLAIFCIEQDQPITQKILLMFPIVLVKAWQETGTVRVIDKNNTEDLRNTLEITKTPTILLYEKGECVKRIEDETTIIDFMKVFSFYSAQK